MLDRYLHACRIGCQGGPVCALLTKLHVHEGLLDRQIRKRQEVLKMIGG